MLTYFGIHVHLKCSSPQLHSSRRSFNTMSRISFERATTSESYDHGWNSLKNTSKLFCAQRADPSSNTVLAIFRFFNGDLSTCIPWSQTTTTKHWFECVQWLWKFFITSQIDMSFYISLIDQTTYESRHSPVSFAKDALTFCEIFICTTEHSFAESILAKYHELIFMIWLQICNCRFQCRSW